jgi:isopenicillin N synthase-like dioxygenase
MLDHIPIINLSAVRTKDPKDSDWDLAAKELSDALSSIGFAYLAGHGIPQQTIQNVFKSSKDFFDLPLDVKLKYRKKDFAVSYSGYAQPGDEIFDPTRVNELREFFDYCEPTTIWPNDECPQMKKSMDALREECNDLGLVMFKLLAKALEIKDEEFFNGHHLGLFSDDVASQMTYRTMHYPPIPDKYELLPGAIRCAEHTDYGTITFLFQDDLGGLEVKTVDKQWIPAEPIEGTILINTADLLELWSGGKFPATPHRVLIPKDEKRKKNSRQCITYFIYPDMATNVTPVVPVVDPKFANVPPINAGEYFQKRVDYTFNIKS